MTTWIDRIQPDLTLISPSNIQFTATWRGDARHLEKRLGVFDYPQLPGAIVQDMGVTAPRYPLSFYFDGPDHDLTAAQFFNACSESGVWTIFHPTLGTIHLQLVNVTEEISPVDSGGVTAFTSEWIEPMDVARIESIPQLAEEIKDQIVNVEEKAFDQAKTGIVTLTTLGKIIAFKNSVMTTIKGVKAQVKKLRSEIEGVYRAITEEIQSDVMSATSLVGEVQVLVNLPGQTLTDMSSRFDFYGKTLETVFTGTVTDAQVVMRELVAISCLTGMSQAVVDCELTTREDALFFLDSMITAFTTMTNTLDGNQNADTRITEQFFSQSTSYNDTALLVAMTCNMLLRRSYDLAVAKRFTLTSNRVPQEIAITEGVDLDMFIATNHLSGDDILLLPAGRQVVVYI